MPLARYREKTKQLNNKIEEANKSITAMMLAKDEKQEELATMCEATSLASFNKNEVSLEPQKSLEFQR